MIDHVAYTVHSLADPEIHELMVELLGFEEFEATPDYRARFMQGHKARWFRLPGTSLSSATFGAAVHLVEDSTGLGLLGLAERGLEHVCFHVGPDRYEKCSESRLCVRNSGSGRVWLEACGLRVEVHP